MRGDKGLTYGRIMEVMATITQAGFTKVALLAEQTGGPAQPPATAARRPATPAPAAAAPAPAAAPPLRPGRARPRGAASVPTRRWTRSSGAAARSASASTSPFSWRWCW